MAQAMVNFRMDADLKRNMERTCKEMGLTMTSAFTMFATKVTRERRIPFEVVADSFNRKEPLDESERGITDIKSKKDVPESSDSNR